MIVTDYNKVKALYAQAAKDGWVIPCICSENQTTTEAILSACSDYAKKIGRRIPITIAITVNYSHRRQAVNYSNAHDWRVGLELFASDAATLSREGGAYGGTDVMLHLDHVQFDDDLELINGDLSGFSSIMYDASALPFDENIKLTRKFVERAGGSILIEGACDEIVEATGAVHNDLTTPEKAERFITETGADLIVANLGTEHRATGKELKYHGDAARAIKAVIGEKIVLHGASSVNNEQIRNLFDDGICKVNIWTALERDSSKVLFAELVKNAEKVCGEAVTRSLIDDGYLTEKCFTGSKIDISFFTTAYRQGVVFNAMKQMVTDYLELWYESKNN